MAKKTIKECENIEFLPPKFQEELKEQSDKNILSTLCCDRLRFSDYAKTNGGFFFTSLKELAEESLVDESTVKRRLALLQMKKYIDRKSGTNHQCTHYKLSKEIEQLLGIEDDEYFANEPLDKIREDKNRLDKTSQVKTSLIVNNNIEKNDDLKIHFEEEFSKSSDNVENLDVEALMTEWYYKFKDCESLECFDALKKECFKVFQPLAMNGLLSEERFDDVVRNRMRETETHIRARKPNM